MDYVFVMKNLEDDFVMINIEKIGICWFIEDANIVTFEDINLFGDITKNKLFLCGVVESEDFFDIDYLGEFDLGETLAEDWIVKNYEQPIDDMMNIYLKDICEPEIRVFH